MSDGGCCSSLKGWPVYSSNRTYSRAILRLSAVLTLSFTSLVAPVNAEEPETVVPATAELEGEAPATLRSAETGLFDAAPPKPVARGAAGDLQLPAVNEKEVFEEGRVIRAPEPDQSRCYRIPALVTAKNGDLLLAFDNRYGGGDGAKTWCRDAPYENMKRINRQNMQTDIQLYRSVDNGQSFEDFGYIAQGTADVRELSYTDPALVTDRTTGKIFAFFVRAYDYRVGQSSAGFNEGDVEAEIQKRDVQDTVVVESLDGGQAWGNMRLLSALTAKVSSISTGDTIFDGRGRFVTSGAGIQLQYGEHAGRLIVPISVDIDPKDSAKFINLAIYSDDHGQTWQAGIGTAGGAGFSGDESKIVELSDGRLMMSSKDNDKPRWVSYSEDQGENWSTPKRKIIAPPQHPEKHNTGINVGLIRAYPNAPENSAAARVLLYSAPIDQRYSHKHTEDGRNNGWVMGSCDDGKTWSFGRQIEKNRFQYSSMTVMSDGNIGMVYESGDFSTGMNLKFAKFNMAWLGADCLSNEALGLTGDIDKEIVEAQEKAAEATKEAQEAAEKVQKLTEELAAARKENDELKNQVKGSKEAVGDLANEVEDLADKVFKLETAVTEAKEKATVAEKAASDAVTQLQKAESIAEEQKAKAESAAAEAQALREKLERLEGSILTVKENPEAEEIADLSSTAKDAADAARRAATDANGALSGQKQDEEKPAMGLMGILKVLAGIIPLVAIIATIFQTFRLPFNIPGMR
ncbi:sialidase [Corynebacterium diphtheriae]|nr:sialidase [Corynebacterium diphtheriae]